MSDQSTNYVIGVTDGIASSIQPRLKAIGDAAMSAGSGCASLQKSIDKLNASGITSISQALTSAGAAQKTLQATTTAFGRTAKSAANSTDALTAALIGLETQAQLTATNMAMLATATGNFAAGAKSVVNTSRAVVQSQNATSNALHGTVSAVQAASTSAMILEGRIPIRGFERFTVSVLKLGPALQAAFPIFGAIAFLEVLGRMYESVMRVVDAYKAMQIASIQAANQAVIDGERVIKVKPASWLSAEGVANFFNDSPKQETITIKNATAALREIEAQKEVAAARARANEAGLQGAALAAQRTKDAQLALENLRKEKAAVDALTKSYRDQSEATVTVLDKSVGGAKDNPGLPVYKQVAKITDPKQQQALQQAMRQTSQESARLSTAIQVAELDLQAMGKKEPLAVVRDGAKAAAAEMKLLNDQLNKLKAGPDVLSASQVLDFWTKNKNKLPGNTAFQQAIDAKIGESSQAADRQAATVSSMIDGLNDQVAAIGAYGDARKIQLAVDKQVNQLQRDNIPVSQELFNTLSKLNSEIVRGADYQRALTSAYEYANQPADDYEAAQRAISELMQNDPANVDRYAQALFRATEAYQRATNPLYDFEQGLKDQSATLGVYGNQLETVRIRLQLIQQLRAQGVDPNSARGQDYVNRGTAQGAIAARSQRVNTLVGGYSNTDAQDALRDRQNALNEAFDKGMVSAARYQSVIAQLRTDQADLAIKMGDTSWATKVTSAIGHLADGFTTFNEGASKSLNSFYSTLADGFADSVGRAIAYAQDFGAAISDVARQAVAGLISSLVKLGVQWLVTKAIGSAAQASATAESVAQGTTVAAAWAPAAAFASLASFGANAGPADAAIITTTALTDALSFAKFAGGGPVFGPGTSTSDSIPAMLSSGEYVVNARATRENYALLDAINNGRTLSQPQVQKASTGKAGMNVIVHNYAGARVQQQQLDENTVRLIIRDEVPDLVAAHAPGVIANDISNPNSKTSKAITRNVTPGRIR